MKYRRRPVTVEAIRVGAGDDWLRAFEWLADIGVSATMHITTRNPEDDYIEVRDEATDTEVRAYTDWWMVHLDGRIWTLTPAEFEAEYEHLSE